MAVLSGFRTRDRLGFRRDRHFFVSSHQQRSGHPPDSAGSATATTIPGVEDFVVAAAVAAVKVIAGWDESETIVVTVDERRVPVVMRLQDRTWQASAG
jgi:hypothetical protein